MVRDARDNDHPFPVVGEGAVIGGAIGSTQAACSDGVAGPGINVSNYLSLVGVICQGTGERSEEKKEPHVVDAFLS